MVYSLCSHVLNPFGIGLTRAGNACNFLKMGASITPGAWLGVFLFKTSSNGNIVENSASISSKCVAFSTQPWNLGLIAFIDTVHYCWSNDVGSKCHLQ